MELCMHGISAGEVRYTLLFSVTSNLMLSSLLKEHLVAPVKHTNRLIGSDKLKNLGQLGQ